MTSDTSSQGQASPRISWWKMTDRQIIDAMAADTVVNKVRKLFSSAVARLEQEGAQRRPAGIVDIRRMEFEESEKIVKAVEGALRDRVEALTSILTFLRDNIGECIGDHPSWIARIDAVLGAAEQRGAK